jgi:hypothetical protein
MVHPHSQVSDTFLIFETVSVGGKVASTLDGDLWTKVDRDARR